MFPEAPPTSIPAPSFGLSAGPSCRRRAVGTRLAVPAGEQYSHEQFWLRRDRPRGSGCVYFTFSAVRPWRFAALPPVPVVQSLFLGIATLLVREARNGPGLHAEAGPSFLHVEGTSRPGPWNQ